MSFPSLEVCVEGVLYRHLQRAAMPLGITLLRSDERATAGVASITASSPADLPESHFLILVARSAHGQASCWAPAKVTPSTTCIPGVGDEIGVHLQHHALEWVASHQVVGVVAVIFDEDLRFHSAITGVDGSWQWTVEATITDAFEQHLRAILDLPLGDPAMLMPCVATAPIVVGPKPDMYHPYLHLFARDPALRVHLDPSRMDEGAEIGHVSAMGDDPEALMERVLHAAEYFSGVVDE